MEKNRRNRKVGGVGGVGGGRLKSIIFLSLSKNFNLILFVLVSGIGTTILLLHSGYGNAIDVEAEKNIANAQLQDSAVNEENIVDLKVSERNNNFVWTSVNGQVNPELDLKSGTHYTIQIESMDNNNVNHQLIIQTENGKQLTKSAEISNGKTDDFPFTFSDKGKFQYHCQYHPETMHGNIVVS